MTVIGVADPFDGRRSIAGEGMLRLLTDATVLEAADVRAALALSRLAGDADDAVQLAMALAVRAVRLGHVYVDLTTAATTVTPDDEELDIDLAALPWPDPTAWQTLVAANPLTAVGEHGPADRPLRLLGSRLYLDRYWRHERSIVADLLDRTGTEAPPSVGLLGRTGSALHTEGARPSGSDARRATDIGERSASGTHAPHVDATTLADGLRRLFPDAKADDLQLIAATTAVERRFSVMAGGPGTGKTTTVARILVLLYEQAAALGQPPPRVALAAPTGKAAARLAEAVHAEAVSLDTDPAIRAALVASSASTIHRLLGWQPGSRSRFRHNADNQLPHNVVIIDESSMVGLSMMAKLLAAVRPTARLVLVGDPRQLASVEAGAVLGDIVSSKLPGIVVLHSVYRYRNGIAAVAEAVESGDGDAVIAALRSSPDDVTWHDLEPTANPGLAPELSAVRAAVVDTARQVVAAARDGDGAAALAALRSVQVLCAHRRGPAGASLWRVEIERWLRAAIPGYGDSAWYAGRPLLITENDYALGVFNGDTGVIVDEGNGRLRALFDRRGQILSVRPTRLASVESLYAMTIHKAQGSQFGTVVVRLPQPTSPVLTRELLYTAVTRAQDQLTVIGSEAAIRAAVARPVARASGLADALGA